MTMSTERTSPLERVFAGQTAVVVGSEHGIGRASATLLSRRGARAACLDRNLEGAQGLVDSLGSEAPDAVALEMNVTDERAVRATVSEAERRLAPSAYWSTAREPPGHRPAYRGPASWSKPPR